MTNGAMEIPVWYLLLPFGIGAAIGLIILVIILWIWPLLPRNPT